jgi:hypothetical protein
MLPTINTPTATVKLPVSGIEVRVKAFTLREDKTMALVRETGGEDDIIAVIGELVKSCVISGGKPDPLDYSDTDLAVIFLKLNEISKGHVHEYKYTCQGTKGGAKCGTVIPCKVDFNNFKIIGQAMTKPIQLSGNVSVKLRYPTLADAAAVKDLPGTEAKHLALVARTIERVYSGTELYEEFTQEEISEWLLDFPTSVAGPIADFYKTAPVIRLPMKIECPECGWKMEWELGALEDFFGSGMLAGLL